ncbi:MAG: tyrosine-protein phosphatase [Lachnospiraceae bacterium]|nr:tyrosine-protein phosphatase [Lachnospiraceae bacterium]
MQKKNRANYVRLPLEKAYNVRDLGGYPGEKGRATKYHSFLRTDDLSEITTKDKAFLKSYGVTAAIDLRGVEEAEKYPNPFRDDPDVNYINLPFITEGIIDMRKIQIVGFHVPTFYKQLIDSHELVLKIMKFIIAQKGCVLFHCMAGKDRTGVVAMILLGLCGVGREDIIANYQITRTYLKGHVDLHLREELADLEFSRPEWMAEAYDYLMEKYETMEDYLMEVGLSKTEIKKLKRKLI